MLLTMLFEFLFGLKLLFIVISIIINSRTLRKLPPGPSPILPWFGNILHLIKYRKLPSYKVFEALGKTYGPIVHIRFGGADHVIVHDLTVAKEMLNSKIWSDRRGKIFEDTNLGIIFASGFLWKETRRFTTKSLKDFGLGHKQALESIIDEEIALVLQSLDKCSMTEVNGFFTLSILNVLWCMVAGDRFSHDDPNLIKITKLLQDSSARTPRQPWGASAFPLLWRLFSKNYKNKKVPRCVIPELRELIKDIVADRKRNSDYMKQTSDLIDAFLQEIDLSSKKGETVFTEEHLLIVCCDLFLAGADTTSNTLEFAILYVTVNPHIQLKIQEEIDKVIGKDRRPTLADKEKMPYINATLLEVQRHANVMPVIWRRSTEESELHGFRVPKGTVAGIPSVIMHKDPTVWGEDCDIFRPERFLNDPSLRENLLSFGLGKRVCIGESLASMSLFLYFTSLLQRYKFSFPANGNSPSTEPKDGYTLSPQPFSVELVRRSM